MSDDMTDDLTATRERRAAEAAFDKIDILKAELFTLRTRLATAEADLTALRAQLATARLDLSSARAQRDTAWRDVERMKAESEKDEAAHDALVASLTDELRRAKAKADQYQCDWMAAKAEFGDKLAALRARHAEAVKAAWYEGWNSMGLGSWRVPYMAWDESEAKAALEQTP